MEDQELAKKLKENLEKINGISNVRLHPGMFRGGEQKEAYLEYHLTSPNFEKNSTRLYFIIYERIKNNFPYVSIDYVKPDIINNEINLRRIMIYINETIKPHEKEQIVKDVAQELNNIIENYLLKK